MSEKLTVLYVDDEPLNLMLFERNFARTYNILTAKSGFEGLEKLRSHPEIKVVISDMRMPGINGIEFVSMAKKEFPTIAYFILTGFAITDEIAHALESKLILHYFSKPFNKTEIEAAITKVAQ